MKLKTINAVICKKFDEWVTTINDGVLRNKIKEGTICTGGAIASMLLNEPINDFDFYFRDYDTALAAARYYVEKFKSRPKFEGGRDVEIFVDTVNDSEAKDKPRVRIVVKSAGVASENNDGYQYFESRPDGEAADYVAQVLDNAEQDKKKTEEKEKYRPVFLSANAISLSNDIQLVVRFYGEPAQIHENYDYVHVTNYWTSWDRQVVTNQKALLSLMNKDLQYIGSRYPLCSLFRTRKFLKREWKITAGQVLKIAMNLQKYDLLNIAILEEQLTGVDVAYFHDLIERIKAKGDTRVDESYLGELIDKLF